MFSYEDSTHFNHLIEQSSKEDVVEALHAAKIGLPGLAALLSPAADDLLPQMATRSKQLTLLRFGKTIQLYAPLYLSNFCTNRCSYCGFSADNRIERRALSLDEAAAEAMLLKERGFNHILLVSGEAPNVMGVDYLQELAKRLSPHFAAISIEVQPLSTEEYTILFHSGVTGVAIYQETYNRSLYDTIHLAGKKKDFDHRIETPYRAAVSGMREVGIGALLGLSDWRSEGVALGYHLLLLRKFFWKTAFTVSFPRLRPAAGAFTPLVHVTERDLCQLLFALRIFDQDVGLILSTREENAFRDGMIGLGPTRYSAGSCTAPGGYTDPSVNGEQFSVGDHRSLREIAEVIRNAGHDAVHKDWDSTFQQVQPI